jgi:transketolase
MPIAVGIALAGRLNKKSYRTYCLVGDGEMMEGTIWEAAMAAVQFKLGNLVVILDRNGLCLDGFTEEIMGVEPVIGKWKAFNWNTVDVDGNNLEELVNAFENLPSSNSNIPTVIVAQTTKGKGVSFMENNPLYHHAAIDEEQLKKALAEVDATYQKVKGGAKA